MVTKYDAASNTRRAIFLLSMHLVSDIRPHKFFFVVFMLFLDLINLNLDTKTTISDQLA